MLKRQILLLCAIGCIVLFGAGTAMMSAPSVHQGPASSVNGQPLHISPSGVNSGSPSYIYQLASAATKASKPSPYTKCPGGVIPDFPKPHDGGGGKRKAPGPFVEPCGPYGGPVTHG